jgi:hypothetical protein
MITIDASKRDFSLDTHLPLDGRSQGGDRVLSGPQVPGFEHGGRLKIVCPARRPYCDKTIPLEHFLQDGSAVLIYTMDGKNVLRQIDANRRNS